MSCEFFFLIGSLLLFLLIFSEKYILPHVIQRGSLLGCFNCKHIFSISLPSVFPAVLCCCYKLLSSFLVISSYEANFYPGQMSCAYFE